MLYIVISACKKNINNSSSKCWEQRLVAAQLLDTLEDRVLEGV